MGKLLELYVGREDRHYLPIKKYNHQTGGEFIGEIKDSLDFQYVGNAITSYGNIYFDGETLPFAKIKAARMGRGYEFTLFVDSEKLFSSELKRLSVLSTNRGSGSILSSAEYKKIIDKKKKRK